MILPSFSASLRTLRRYPLHTVLNSAGLAVGIAACALIALFIRSEVGYDQFHPDADRLFRISMVEMDESGQPSLERALISPAVASALAERLPQIERFARFTPVGPLLSVGDTHIAPDHTFWTDTAALDLFGFEWLSGSPQRALEDPYSLVLSATVSNQLFDTTDAAGKVILVSGEDAFTVAAVFADLPEKTHLPVDVLGSIRILERWFGTQPDDIWDSPNYASYVRLSPGVDADALQAELSGFMDNHGGRNAPGRAQLLLQPISDIHLHSSAVSELTPQGSADMIRLLAIIALLILLIAATNFVSLTQASANRRTRGLGLRKVAGATRGQLVLHSVSEAVVIGALAGMVAIFIVVLLLPSFETFLGRSLDMMGMSLIMLIGLIEVVSLLIGLAAGAIPAWRLSAVRPVALFRGGQVSPKGSVPWQSIPAISQFVMASGLLFATLIVYQQVRFMTTADPGHRVEGVLIMPGLPRAHEDFKDLRVRLESREDIVSVTHAFQPPLRPLQVVSDMALEIGDEMRTAQVYPMWSDDRYVPTYGLSMAAGRNLDESLASDRDGGVLLNETAVARLGLPDNQEAVGKLIRFGGREGVITGVVQDFHQESMHAPVAPMIFFPRPDNYRHVGVRFETNDVHALVEDLKDAWAPFVGNYPYDPTFLDQQFEQAYRSERRLATLFGFGAGMSIFVACLGLFGMASVIVQRRIREIGIRKALGADKASILGTISNRFLAIAAASAVVGSLATWMLMTRWLQQFAYRIDIGWQPFALVLALTSLSAAVAISIHVVRAASTNPVRALRHVG